MDIDESRPSGPLSDITVIEVAEGVAGSFCGRMLAAFGANVIKVERPQSGSWTRHAKPQLEGFRTPEASALNLYTNMGKKSVTIDWDTPDGMDSLRGLLAGTDVLIDDWSAEHRGKLGLAQNDLHSISESLINLSITPFGLHGPYSNWQSTPIVSLALGGYLYLSGSEFREPLMLPGYQAQYLTAMQAYAGVLLALGARDETGRAQPVELAEMEVLGALHQFTTTLYTYSGEIRKRAGTRLAIGSPRGGYPITTIPCKDGYITFSASAAQQWDMLCAMIGREDMLDDPKFATFANLRVIGDEIDEILKEWTRDKTRQEIADIAAGIWSVPASPVLNLDEVLADTQYVERGLFQEFEQSDGDKLTFPTVPFKMSKTNPTFSRAPSLGEHNSAIGKALPPKKSQSTGRPASRNRLLEGIRILDLTRVWAGPLATRILGDFGAHVIKMSDPRVPIDRWAGVNNKHNRNKPSLGIRLDTPEGKEAFLELVAISDIVIESFRPRVMRNFGLSYDALREVRPDIIMCAISGYGAAGEYAEFPAYGTSVESITGIPSIMGYEGGPPLPSCIAYPDPIAGLNAIATMLTALRHRRMTGEGQFIDVALSEGPICHMGEIFGAFGRDGIQPTRNGNSHYRWAPHGVFQTTGDDCWIAIAITTDDQWQSLCEAMKRSELASDEKYSTESARKANERELDQIISHWTVNLDAKKLMHELQSKGVPAGAVNKNVDLLNDPHLNSRDFFVELDEADIGYKMYPGQAIRTNGIDRNSWKASSRLGENNSDILNALLGHSESSTTNLHNKGVIGTYLDF